MQRTTLPALLPTFLAPPPAVHPPPSAAASTNYVDAATGDDGATGRSPDSAWRTLDRVNATTFTPGDRLLLRAGAGWHGQLSPKRSGDPGRPVTIDRYGHCPGLAMHGDGVVSGLHGAERTGPRLDRALASTPAANSPAAKAGAPDNGNCAGHQSTSGHPT